MAKTEVERQQAVVPTTKAQVSGHRFLRRRVAHGLVFGDIRMIHDPLASRSRALIFGVVATVLVALGMGLMAWLRPNPDPGEAPIVRDSSHGLYVQMDGVVHPVPNLMSARLIAGAPADPESMGDDNLRSTPRGVPVGIPAAPSIMAEAGAPEWLVCMDDTDVVVVAQERPPRRLAPGTALLAQVDGAEWIISGTGRRELIDGDPLTVILKRQLGIGPDTPRIELPAEVLAVLPELPAWRAPGEVGEVVQAASQWWWLRDGAVTSLTVLQARLLQDLGAPARVMAPSEVAALPDATAPAPYLPEAVPTWELGQNVCVSDSGAVVRTGELAGIELAGEGVADRFVSDAGGAFAVDSGFGVVVVGESGLRHDTTEEDFPAMGLPEPVAAPWNVVRLLPAGEDLTSDNARVGLY